MLTCPNPVCKKSLKTLNKQCPHCRTDLTLLIDYIGNLQEGLDKAEALAHAGELGEAVWAYLEVLETDPDNGPARTQIGRVVTAVRTFDLSTPARRVAIGLPAHEAKGFWKNLPSTERLLGGAVVLLLGFILGMMVGMVLPKPAPGEPEPTPLKKNDNDQIGPPA